jgi:hypothetical protein
MIDSHNKIDNIFQFYVFCQKYMDLIIFVVFYYLPGTLKEANEISQIESVC